MKILEKDFDLICKIYIQWKELNNNIKKFSSRGVNFPDCISEPIVCYVLNYNWNNNNETGDATSDSGELIEIKATSNFDSDLSSFSPNTKFDKLIFVRLDQERDLAYIYDLELNFEQFQILKVNKKETVLDQQKQNRRPRLSLIQYIEKEKIEPLYYVDFIKKIVTKN
ncbi:Bsp6I family restriction endonuclease [Campylobacter jejuni]|nr:Bsp6I family restriction endonuclease [Campylobacter jejuni]EDP3838826.1 Bsp6I family restriction endonuclease [Campylobacter jejuni]